MRSDAALAERVTAGDEAAFDVLYERHRAVVLAVAMGVLGTMHDAEDATQETFSALAISLRTKPPAELRPWLIRVARNAAIDTTRRRRHRLLTLDGEIPEAPARPTGGGKAELAVVFDGIRELPEGQRMALLMRELGGHTYAEIADFLATDEEAVKGLIARARVGLRAFREASELPCASARTTIAAEPDGRRYDRTVRRHLRACASCRSYRDALRDDAKALRAGLPLQAGGVAAGTGIGAGPLAAAKGAMVGYSLTQAAATCAASACAVGAVGSMVLMGPLHRFGLPTILPAAQHAKAHRADAKLVTANTHVKVSTHARLTLHASGDAVTPLGSRTSDATAPRAAARSHAVPALNPHDGHQPVVVEHSTLLQVTATPTTSTTPLSSIPITTPAGSQPATQGPQSPGQAATTTSAVTSPVTSSQSQSTSASPSTTASASTSASQSPSQGSGSNAGTTSTGPSSTQPASTNPSSAVSDAIASRAVQEATERPPSATSSTGSSSPAGGYQSDWSEFGWSNPEYGGGYVGSAANPPGTTGTTPVITGAPGQNTAPTGNGAPDQNTPPTDTGTPNQNTPPTDTGAPDQNTPPTDTGTPDQNTPPTDTGTPNQDTGSTDTGTQTSTPITTTSTSTDSSPSPSLEGTSAETATDTSDASADS